MILSPLALLSNVPFPRVREHRIGSGETKPHAAHKHGHKNRFREKENPEWSLRTLHSRFYGVSTNCEDCEITGMLKNSPSAYADGVVVDFQHCLHARFK